ncbi:MAG TPA: hypothetical protein VK498_08975 [Ferruginibacter sp.]|nr:hypothetical protein [Ferruginibacter sp.]
MKSLSKTMLMLLLILSAATGFSQGTSTPNLKIFENFPDEIALSATTLRDAFTSRNGDNISLQLGNNFNFTGVVLSNEIKYTNLRSIAIKSPSFNDAVFHLSQITNEDNSITFVGRIYTNAFDGYEIKKDVAGNYIFRKFETKKILQDCSQ